MATLLTVSGIDHSGEMSQTRFWLPTLTAANFDALMNQVTGKAFLLQTTWLAATSLVHVNTSVSIKTATGPGTPPVDVSAQREIAVRVSYRDVVNGRAGSLTVPGPDLLFYPPTGSDNIPLNNVVALVFIAALELNAVSQDGNAISVTALRLIGRNT